MAHLSRGPHQLLLDASGKLMVANGGILRAEGDKKRDLQLMDSSLVRMDPLPASNWVSGA